MKDNFSTKSKEYHRFRPRYPVELFEYLKLLISSDRTAWDCGTGNGQIACELARFVARVEATDISEEQIKHACRATNIFYTRQPAEKTNFAADSFDLITVGQAIHWFNFSAFYKEVNRTLKPQGIIAVIGYGLFKCNSRTDALIQHFYSSIVGPYWDPERNYLEENYTTIPFPFQEIPTPDFKIQVNWSFAHLTGYLKTWSAVKHFEKAHRYNPVDDLVKDLERAFGKKNTIVFPLLLRVGRK